MTRRDAQRTQDDRCMVLAINEARRSKHDPTRVDPHPAVGAVAVDEFGNILAAAHHGEFGGCEHAEYTLLEKKLQTTPLASSTIYTTLEPCVERNHPKVPCAARLVERRVKRVVIGMLDPNQSVTGKGILQLRRGGIAVDLSTPGQMAEIEDLNRDFIRFQNSSVVNNLIPGAIEAGLRAFYPSRDYYPKFRADAATIDRYVGTAKHSAVLVSINLMTGIPFHDLCQVLGEKLSQRQSKFRATISLLDHRQESLTTPVESILRMRSGDLRTSIQSSLLSLLDFRNNLPKNARSRLGIHLHSVLPFGSAILLDHKHPFGRIQIETKPYRVGLQQSVAFEIGPTTGSQLYDTLTRSYLRLINDGEEITSPTDLDVLSPRIGI